MKRIKSTLIMTAIITTTVLGAVEAANASCTIVLKKKTATAKTYYTPSGESLSLKMLTKLKPQCDFKVSMMTMAELHEFKIKALKNKLSKLQAPKTLSTGGL